jgi:hypothetical protein
MKVQVILRREEDWTCPEVETARLTVEEAEAYVAAQELLYPEDGEEAVYFFIEEVDMKLGLARELVTP